MAPLQGGKQPARGGGSSAVAPDPLVVAKTGPRDQCLVLGTLAWFTFVGLWVGGLSSPLLLVGLLLSGRRVAAGLLLAAVVGSYLPRSSFPVRPRLRRVYRWLSSAYFRRSSLSFETAVDPERPTLYCVHPHGIFAIGWAMACLGEQLGHVRWCVPAVSPPRCHALPNYVANSVPFAKPNRYRRVSLLT